MKIPKYFYFRVRVINKGTGVEVEDASDADVVEVVRCKDCKWFYDCRKDGWGRCGEHDDYGRDSGWWQATDFCSWGERKDEVTDERTVTHVS